MFSKFFIDRPVLAGVIAIIIVIAGLVASAILPIAQYPDIAPPTVVVNTSYPGASAETIAKTVAAPIEERLSGVRSEERRVGKECRSRWSHERRNKHEETKKNTTRDRS